MKRALYFLLGLIGFLSLLCSVAASCVTNGALMQQGFLQFSQTVQMGVSASRYGDYAATITDYLDGKTDAVRVKNPDSGETELAFSEKENLHLKDVRGIVTALKAGRWLGGAVVVLIAVLYFTAKERQKLLSELVRGFALAALTLLALFTGLAVWGIVNFDGLFVTFHKVAFNNDLWLLNPNTDVLLALMPLPFFTWYVGEMLKALAPVLIMMALVVVAWGRIRKTQKETETK